MRKRTLSQQGDSQLAESNSVAATAAHMPRKLTFAENVILTIKIFVVFLLLGAALWAIDVCIAAS